MTEVKRTNAKVTIVTKFTMFPIGSMLLLLSTPYLPYNIYYHDSLYEILGNLVTFKQF